MNTYVRRAINSVGLDNSVSYVHDFSKGENSLTFDLMELWRVNIDYSVLQTFTEMKNNSQKKKMYGFTDRYEVEITSDTAKLLFEKIILTKKPGHRD